MGNNHTTLKKGDFGAEIARILPLILREFARRQQDVFAKIPLTIPQIVILELLLEKGTSKMNELARTLNFTMSAVTAIVDKMVRLKVVKRERSTEDRRVVKVSILNKGKEIVTRVSQARQGCVNEMFSALTKDEKNEYIRILRKVLKNLRKGK